jgi:hypothetical protein
VQLVDHAGLTQSSSRYASKVMKIDAQNLKEWRAISDLSKFFSFPIPFLYSLPPVPAAVNQ